jgi:hypothetical protein
MLLCLGFYLGAHTKSLFTHGATETPAASCVGFHFFFFFFFFFDTGFNYSVQAGLEFVSSLPPKHYLKYLYLSSSPLL